MSWKISKSPYLIPYSILFSPLPYSASQFCETSFFNSPSKIIAFQSVHFEAIEWDNLVSHNILNFICGVQFWYSIISLPGKNWYSNSPWLLATSLNPKEEFSPSFLKVRKGLLYLLGLYNCDDWKTYLDSWLYWLRVDWIYECDKIYCVFMVLFHVCCAVLSSSIWSQKITEKC